MTMPTVAEAFDKFRGKISTPTEKESNDASRRQKEIRSVMAREFHVQRDFLSGSYARWTKTKPLKDVDIFCVLKPAEDHYRSKPPSVVLTDFHAALAEKYGDCAKKQNRSINVDFG